MGKGVFFQIPCGNNAGSREILKQASCAETVNIIWPLPRFNCGEASHLK